MIANRFNKKVSDSAVTELILKQIFDLNLANDDLLEFPACSNNN